ncbi:hypothetical protein F5Y19DRAFT_370888 [Xylariaceae sp. FL1651]|nr:hypothetical protein F5Y19DRAFT_370888 [Xylariaceae sp. FL1651]
MDPISALAFASSIFATIDFSAKVLKGAYGIYMSSSDTTTEAGHVSSVIDDLRAATNAIEIGFRGSSPHEVALTKLAKKSAELSRDIVKTLDSIRVQGNKSKWRTLKASLKSAIKSGKLESLTKTVQDYRSEIILQLNLLLVDDSSELKKHIEKVKEQGKELQNETCGRLDKTRIELGNILAELKSVSAKDRAARLDNASLISDVRNLLKSLICMTESVTYENIVLSRLYFPSLHWREDTVSDSARHTFRWIIGKPSKYYHSDDIDSDKSSDGSTSDGESLDNVISDGRSSRVEHPDDGVSQDDSQDGGSSGDQDSDDGSSEDEDCDDIYDWERKEYAQELEEEDIRRQEVSRDFEDFLKRRNGIFFVTGKAGCGKSTLLKYIRPSGNHFVKRALDHWANTRQRPLVFIPIYFWAAGDTLQKSMEGFYRTLLFQLLRQCPELIRSVFPHSETPIVNPLFKDYPFRMPEIMAAASHIAKGRVMEDYSLCLFIDGLDEFEGDKVDRVELARLLRQLADHPYIKILCSARPYPEFLDIFQKDAITVHLHELTRGDIALYSFGALRQEQKRQLGPESSWTDQHRTLVRRIVHRSEGIFVWSRAVVRFLSSKIGHHSPGFLVSLLQETPQSLYELYRQMLSRREPMSKRKGNKMLLLAMGNPLVDIDPINALPLNALAYSWLDELEDTNFPMSSKPTCYSDLEINRRLDLVRRELNDGTAGLLEIRRAERSGYYLSNYYTHPFFRNRVEPIHRTARDFLVNDWLTSDVPSTNEQIPKADIYWRICLAEVKYTFAVNMHFTTGTQRTLNFPHLTAYSVITSRFDRLVSLEQSLRFNLEFYSVVNDYQHLIDSEGVGEGWALLSREHSYGSLTRDASASRPVHAKASALHHALYWGQERYVRQQISLQPNVVLEGAGRLSLLLTSCLRWGSCEMIRALLDAGATYSSTVSVRLLHRGQAGSHDRFTVWLILLRFLSFAAVSCLQLQREIPTFSHISNILDETLQTQDSDWDAVVLVLEESANDYSKGSGLPKDEISVGNRAVSYIELESLLELLTCVMTDNSKSVCSPPACDYPNVSLGRLLSFQAGRARAKAQKSRDKSLRGWLAELWGSAQAEPLNRLADAKKKYPRADLENLRMGKLDACGVITKTESLVEAFAVILY